MNPPDYLPIATNAVVSHVDTGIAPATPWTPPALLDNVFESAPLNTTLTAAEQKEFADKKSVITKGWATFLDVANALLAISEKRLYRDKHENFKAFCKDDLGISRQYAYSLIGSAKVEAQLSAIADIRVKPLTESQFRELISVPEENRVDVWKRALNLAGDKPMTAKLVRQAAAYFKAPKTGKPKAKAATGASVNLGTALALLAKAQGAALKNGAANRKKVLKNLEDLRACLEELARLAAKNPQPVADIGSAVDVGNPTEVKGGNL